LKAIYGIMDNVFIVYECTEKIKDFRQGNQTLQGRKYDHRMGRIFRSLHSSCW